MEEVNEAVKEMDLDAVAVAEALMVEAVVVIKNAVPVITTITTIQIKTIIITITTTMSQIYPSKTQHIIRTVVLIPGETML